MVIRAEPVSYKHRPAIDDIRSDQTQDRDSAVSEALFLSIGEGAIVIDELGRVSRINDVALDILGYTAEEVLGKWYPGAVRAEEADGKAIPNIERPVMEAIFTGKPVFRKIYYRRKDKTRVPVALTVSPVMLGEKPLGAIQMFRDITEEMQLEHAKDEFISIASHQLRTPATVVKQYLSLVIDGFVDSPEEQMAMLKLAYEHNDNQLELINDLLKIAQIEANKIAPNRKDTDLVKLLRKIINSQKPSFQKNGDIELITEKSTAICSVDPLQIQMVFENLINNAIKYSPNGGTVTVEVALSKTNVIVRVKDQGIGIDQKDIPRLFNKFSRVENINSTASGTGLGLYWAKKLIDLHHGKISLSSVLGQGTTFKVSLPIKVQI